MIIDSWYDVFFGALFLWSWTLWAYDEPCVVIE